MTPPADVQPPNPPEPQQSAPVRPASDDALRPPLNPGRLAAALAAHGAAWRSVDVVTSTGSTNADLVAAAEQGAPEGCVLVAEEQVAGRGRLDRGWQAPMSSGVLMSVLLRPPGSVPSSSWGWLPLLVGLAVTSSLRETTGVDARLKWPNDVVVDGPGWSGGPGPRKLGGILVERVPGDPVAVAGLGLNVDLRRDELPVPAATSLLLEVAAHPSGRLEPAGREEVLAGIVASLARRYEAFVAARGDADRCGLAASYRAVCLTLGREVRAQLPGGRELVGTAVDLAPDGALLLRTSEGLETVRAGDVVHLR